MHSWVNHIACLPMNKTDLKSLSKRDFIKLYRAVMEEGTSRFGTIEELQVAGEKRHYSKKANEETPKVKTRKRYSKEDILLKIREVYKKYGSINYTLWIKEGNHPPYHTVKHSFGSFAIACATAGVEKNNHLVYSDEEVFEGLRKIAQEYGGTLSAKQYIKSKQKPGYHAIKTRFKSFAIACATAGIKNAYGKREPKLDPVTLNNCPKCGKPWVPPKGSASYCLICEEYAKNRYQKKKIEHKEQPE